MKISAIKNNQQGMIALLTVIIISMAALTMVTTASLIGIDQLDMYYSADQGEEALILADGCLDDILRRIKLDPASLPADYTLPLDNGFCIIGMPNNSVISVAGHVGNYVKRLQANITIDGTKVILNNWQEE
jgi:hypothetical protein